MRPSRINSHAPLLPAAHPAARGAELGGFLYSFAIATLSSADIVSVTEAARRGVSRLVTAAEGGGEVVIARRSTPVAAVVGMDRLTALEEREADLRDLALVLTRLATDSGDRTSLDEVIRAFGLTRSELEALPDDH